MLEWLVAECGEGVRLRLTATPSGVRSIDFDVARPPVGEENPANPLLRESAHQLSAYFAGSLHAFDIPLDPIGTEFQKRVWQALLAIPYGQIRSYAHVAARIGAPAAVRAVGAANGANPIPIVVPCHRVIGSNGKLVGYGGGLPLKQRLLALEGIRLAGTRVMDNMVLFD